jgi:hypothetical protein
MNLDLALPARPDTPIASAPPSPVKPDTPTTTDTPPTPLTPPTAGVPPRLPDTILVKARETALAGGQTASEVGTQTLKLMAATPDLPGTGQDKNVLDTGFDRDPARRLSACARRSAARQPAYSG